MPSGRLPTHGQTKTPLYKVWASMIQRCTDPNCEAYEKYSYLGVCNEWRSFEIFWKWATDYKPGLTLDRSDNEKGYSPDNCQWVTKSQQAQNRGKKSGKFTSKYVGVSRRESGRWQVRVTLNGKTKCLGTFEKEFDAAKTRDIFVIEHKTNHQLNFSKDN